MTTVLHLGVIEMPYADSDKTTGDVAEILEAKYHVMEVFFETNEREIGGFFAESMRGALENLIAGSPVTANPLVDAEGAVEDRFHRFIEQDEMDGLVPGVPTKAARRGVNHRLKIKRGDPRPSFRDTGLYEASFKAWTESS